jgi:hypothetical protein
MEPLIFKASTSEIKKWSITHKAIISGMAVSPEDLVAGTLALQAFIKNAKYVETIVDIALAVVPAVLGIGAVGLIGRGLVQTAKEIGRSISVLSTLGKLRWTGGGGGQNPPTPAPAAPAPAAMAAVEAAGRENPASKTDVPIILQPPTIKIPDKGEGRKNTPTT